VARTIALVEDDPDQRVNCADALRARGYRVEAYPGRAEALAGFDRAAPDLSVLDVILGDERNGGFDLCRDLLARAPDHPVIFLTTRADEISQVAGLTLGAWDYLSKPISLRVLGEKVATLLRIAERSDTPAATDRIIQVGALTLDEGRMRVRWREQPLDLTLAEFRILEGLVRRPGMVSSYEELMESAQLGVVTRNTMTTHIVNIRRKFNVVDAAFDRIQNEYGLGYRWVEE